MLLAFSAVLAWKYSNRIVWDLASFQWAGETAFGAGVPPYGRHIDAVHRASAAPVIHPIFNPPPSLFLFGLFSLVEFETLRWSVFAANLLLVPFCAGMLGLVAKAGRGWPSLFLLGYFASFYPVASTVFFGQVNILVLAFLLIFLWSLPDPRRHALGGASLAFAAAIKTFPILSFLPLVLMRKWKLLLWATGVLLLLLGACQVFLPEGTISAYRVHVLETLGYGKRVEGFPFLPAYPGNLGLNGIVSRFFIDMSFTLPLWNRPGWVPILCLPMAAALLAVMVRPFPRLRGGAESEALAYFLAGALFLSPVVWEHHLVFLLPALVFGLKDLAGSWRSGLRFSGRGLRRNAILLLVLPVLHLKSFVDPSWAADSRFWTLMNPKSYAFGLFSLWALSRLGGIARGRRVRGRSPGGALEEG